MEKKVAATAGPGLVVGTGVNVLVGTLVAVGLGGLGVAVGGGGGKVFVDVGNGANVGGGVAVGQSQVGEGTTGILCVAVCTAGGVDVAVLKTENMAVKV